MRGVKQEILRVNTTFVPLQLECLQASLEDGKIPDALERFKVAVGALRSDVHVELCLANFFARCVALEEFHQLVGILKVLTELHFLAWH